MIPEVLSCEWRDWCSSVTNEAASGVGVHAEQERDEQVVGVPESLERLLSDPVVGGGVNQQHAQQHDVAGNTTSLGVVDFEGHLRANLSLFHVIEVDIMRSGMSNGKHKHSVGNLAMEPYRLVEGEESNFRSEYSYDVSAHGHDNNHCINGQHQTSTSRNPDGILKSIKRREASIALLFPPSYSEYCPVETPKYNVEENLLRGEQLPPIRLCDSHDVVMYEVEGNSDSGRTPFTESKLQKNPAVQR